jgi:hypothetical protein
MWYNVNAREDEDVWKKMMEPAGVAASGPETICYLELLAVVQGLNAIHSITNDSPFVRILSDNMATVCSLNSWKSRSPPMRSLLVAAEKYSFTVRADHIKGEANLTADFISRNQRETCRQELPSDWEYVAMNDSDNV